VHHQADKLAAQGSFFSACQGVDQLLYADFGVSDLSAIERLFDGDRGLIVGSRR